ncbi:LCP family protein [Streptomyces sp. ASQP_92]|uniref:LCP family protein n=1 Tax=Streptomyces sp. ASQP_92 TaxID=2979116 RepID=UPI0021C1BB76|nr:LCP family protein [Streptomyces sp. ASQP_92]MCT9089329.1 LCP family protein [Streptomyces sp. ASQP_92]
MSRSPITHRREKRWSARRLVRTLAACAVVLVLCALAGGWYLYRDLSGSIGTSRALADGAPTSVGGDTNILLMGLDSRKDQNGDDLPPEVLDKLHAGSSDIGGYNTNTLILLHVPADGGRARAFSVPRDDLVDIAGHGQDKIKKAYGLEKARTEEKLAAQGVTDRRKLETAGREAGRRAEIQTVRAFLGVPIDHFAEVNLAGFYHLADALDGVTVCLKKPVKDRYSGADFPAGKQTLNGQQSLAFVRQRHGLAGGDLDRTRRQQAFLASATHKLDSVGTFTDPVRLLHLLNTAKQDLVTDQGWDLLSFLKQAKNLSGGNVEFTTLPIERFAEHRGEDVNIVDPAKIKRIVADAIHPVRSTPPAVPAGPGATPDPKPAPEKPSAPVLDGGGIPCVD